MAYIRFFLIAVILLSFVKVASGRTNLDLVISDTIKLPTEKIMFSTSKIDRLPVFNPGYNIEFRDWLHLQLNELGLLNKCPAGMDIDVKFVITSVGLVDDIKIELNKSVFSNTNIMSVGCINSITKLFKDSEKYWTAGEHNNSPVTVQFSLPIRIRTW